MPKSLAFVYPKNGKTFLTDLLFDAVLTFCDLGKMMQSHMYSRIATTI